MTGPDPVLAVAPGSEDTLWLAVNAASDVGAVRRRAVAVAGLLGLPEKRIADLAIVASELASNLHKHAGGGSMLIRALRHPEAAAVELVALDNGPGMDLTEALRDGHSTSGTLGIGLGGVSRQADRLDGYSSPGAGAVLIASVWSGPPPPPPSAAGLSRPMAGEQVTGDGLAVRELPGRRQLLLCDGLGHGPLAAAAAQATVAAFRAAPDGPPGAVLEHLHRAVRHTRGAVAAVAELDEAAGQLRYSGLGNVSAAILAMSGRRQLVSLPGILGHQRRDLREYTYPWAGGDLLVLHSDGLTGRWDLADYPGLSARPPLVIAAVLLRDAGVRRDDAAVLVARGTP